MVRRVRKQAYSRLGRRRFEPRGVPEMSLECQIYLNFEFNFLGILLGFREVFRWVLRGFSGHSVCFLGNLELFSGQFYKLNIILLSELHVLVQIKRLSPFRCPYCNSCSSSIKLFFEIIFLKLRTVDSTLKIAQTQILFYLQIYPTAWAVLA